MGMVEACIRDIKGANGCYVVTMARDAAPRPLANIFLQAIPSKAFHDKASGGFGAWMGQTAYSVEDLSSEGNWNNRSGNASGSIADNLDVVTKGECCEIGNPVRCNEFTLLLSCYLSVVDARWEQQAVYFNS